MRRVTKQSVLVVMVGLAAVLGPVFFVAWKNAVERNSRAQPAEPFRIAGNFYYIGSGDASTFLLTGPQGHVVIDGDDRNAPVAIASIVKLGFDIRDVKVLLASEAGAMAAMQQASGAQLWASEANASIMASGGADPTATAPLKTLMGIAGGYARARVDHQLQDGQTIRVGPIEITAHITPGNSRGCTSWSFPVRDGDRVLTVVSACSLIRVLGMRYPGQQEDLERSFSILRSLPADIWVTGRSRAWGRYRKFVASTTAKNPVDPFIDPAGYRAYVDAAETELRSGKLH